jgi:hypothetical protein
LDSDATTNEGFTAMFGSLFVTGDDYRDTVCVDKKDVCVDQFRFLSVIDLDPRIIPMDGMIGLAPDDPANGPSFVAALYDSKIIDKKLFGFIFGRGTALS